MFFEQFKLTFADAIQSLPLDFVFVHQSHRLVVLYKDQLQPQQKKQGGKNAELSPGPSTTREKSLRNIATCNHIQEEQKVNTYVLV